MISSQCSLSSPARSHVSCAMCAVLFTVVVKGRVESWMTDVLVEMRTTNRFITKKAIYDYGKDREQAR